MLIVFAQEDWDIYSFHINSTVTSRYAVTVITSRVVNRMDESKEIEFQVRIPKNAFISKFRMCVKQKKKKKICQCLQKCIGDYVFKLKFLLGVLQAHRW